MPNWKILECFVILYVYVTNHSWILSTSFTTYLRLNVCQAVGSPRHNEKHVSFCPSPSYGFASACHNGRPDNRIMTRYFTIGAKIQNFSEIDVRFLGKMRWAGAKIEQTPVLRPAGRTFARSENDVTVKNFGKICLNLPGRKVSPWSRTSGPLVM